MIILCFLHILGVCEINEKINRDIRNMLGLGSDADDNRVSIAEIKTNQQHPTTWKTHVDQWKFHWSIRLKK
jgi:hypothetical protein